MSKNVFLILIFILPLINSCKKPSNYYIQKGDDFYYKEQYEKAIGNYEKALQIDSLNKGVMHSLGRVYEELENYEKAIDYYKLALRLDSNYSLAYRSIGFTYYKIGENEDARRAYLKSLTIDSLNVTAMSNLGAVYEKLDSCGKARNLFYKVIKLNPNHYGVMHKLADIENDLGNIDSCIKLCYRVLGNLTTGLDGPYRTLGEVYINLGQYDSAIYYFKQAIQFNPKRYDYYNNLGLACNHVGDATNAMYYYDKSIELNTIFPFSYVNRADLKYNMTQYIKAIQDYNKAINLSEEYQSHRKGAINYIYNFGYCYYKRALCKLNTGDKVGYIIDIDKAAKNGYSKKNDKFIITELVCK